MNFHDAARPRINSGETPCWLGTDTALPGLYLSPEPVRLPPESTIVPPPRWEVSMMVWRDEGSTWIDVVVLEDQLSTLLSDWENDPELAIRKWFRQDAPTKGRSIAVAIAVASADELGL
jgi:hypothetical protein